MVIVHNNVTIFFEKIFEDYNISKLDIKRIYRYLDKNIKKEVIIYGDDDIADDE
jgi:uncharacterized protein (DUF433 family)